MGRLIEDQPKGNDYEIRRESIKLIPNPGKPGRVDCHFDKKYGWYVEIDKEYFQEIIDFFVERGLEK